MNDSNSVQKLVELFDQWAAELQASHGEDASIGVVMSCGTVIWSRNERRRTTFTESMLFGGDKTDATTRAEFKAICGAVGNDVLKRVEDCGSAKAIRDFRGTARWTQ